LEQPLRFCSKVQCARKDENGNCLHQGEENGAMLRVEWGMTHQMDRMGEVLLLHKRVFQRRMSRR
jgi:hypothetical protein